MTQSCLRSMLALVSSFAFVVPVLAAQAGWRPITIAGATPEAPSILVALYYPTQAPERTVPMGPFSVQAAIGAVPLATVKGLIVLSHGRGGTELGHSSLAEALARGGYFVAALRHPGDNWQDRSLLQKSATRYFSERPRQASRVIDALLRDPEWKDRIARDSNGPRIGALGHSAGGYTVLALAGGEPDVARLAAHCDANRLKDPIFCSMGRAREASVLPGVASAQAPSLADTRVRAVAALAPVGAVFSAQSLAGITIPVTIYAAQRDRFLVPPFHADWIARNVPGADIQRVPNAWHFAFMDTPSMAIPTDDGDIAADPPGFDRKALLDRLGVELVAFFDKTLR